MGVLEILRKEKGLSERQLSSKAELSRETLRKILKSDSSCHLNNYKTLAGALDRDIQILFLPRQTANPELSVFGVSQEIVKNGEPSWPEHLFNFVDEFRRTKDARLIMLPPSRQLSDRLQALFASVTTQLCRDMGLEIPSWTFDFSGPEKPWFVAGMESLKASAIRESPVDFRRRNLFVLDNFLDRA